MGVLRMLFEEMLLYGHVCNILNWLPGVQLPGVAEKAIKLHNLTDTPQHHRLVCLKLNTRVFNLTVDWVFFNPCFIQRSAKDCRRRKTSDQPSNHSQNTESSCSTPESVQELSDDDGKYLGITGSGFNVLPLVPYSLSQPWDILQPS